MSEVEPPDTAMDVDTLWNQTSGRSEAVLETVLFIFNCSVLALTLVLGSLGNLWVCWVVFRTKSLQTSNNALLVSLAASDLLKCSVDTPLLLCSLLGVLGSSVSACTLQQFTYALCSCVQLLTLVGISVERFQAIAFPFQTEGRKVRVRLWICSIWACGLLLALLSLALAEEVTFYLLCRHGQDDPRLWDPFGACVLVPVWGLSLTVIIIHYVRIFRVVRRHRRKVFNQGGTLLLVAEAGAARAGGAGGVQRGGPEIVGAVCLLTPGAKERGKKQMEGKLAQRFGYIIIAFTLLWMPMVVILLLNVFSWQDAHTLLMELETSALVLTCVQAAVDPLIYTLVTRQFRSELSKILSSIPGCPLKPRA